MTFSSEEEIRLRISEHQAKAGRIGGQSRSPEKRKAVADNLKKARAKRWPGREVSASLLLEGINVYRQTEKRTGENGGGSQPEGGGCSPSLHQSDSKPDQSGNGGSVRSRDEGVSGELFGFVFERGVPKGWRASSEEEGDN